MHDSRSARLGALLRKLAENPANKEWAVRYRQWVRAVEAEP